MKLLHAALAACLSLVLPAGASGQTTHMETVAGQPARFTIETVGEGPDVVMIPGLSTPREVWRPNAEKLAATHRVHLVQIRGFGDHAGANTDGPVLQPFVDELAAYLQAEKIADAAVIGHSMGGLAALMIGAQYPDLPGRIMVVDALPFIGVIFGAQDSVAIEGQAAAMRNMIVSAPQGARNPAIDCSAVVNTGTPPPGNMTNTQRGACMVAQWSGSADKHVVGQAMYDDMVTDMRAGIAGITAPMTVVYGRDERGIPTAMMDQLYTSNYAAAPDTEFVPVDGSFHFVMLDQPEQMQAALEAFLAK